jgi:hypothetical protein
MPARRTSIRGAESIVRSTYAWNERQKQFTDRQLRLAVDRLGQAQWIPESAPDLNAL